MERRTITAQAEWPGILLRCDDAIPIQDVEWLSSALEESVRSGNKFQNGAILQTGWMINMLSEVDSTTLEILEPDMQSTPINWVAGVTETLRQLRIQKDAVESVGLQSEMQFPSIRQSAIMGIDVEPGMSSLTLERTSGVENDSGWFIGCAQSRIDYNVAENLKRVSLYEAALTCPQIVMFMSFPSGTCIRFVGEELCITRGGKLLTPRKDSFLEQFLTAH